MNHVELRYKSLLLQDRTQKQNTHILASAADEFAQFALRLMHGSRVQNLSEIRNATECSSSSYRVVVMRGLTISLLD